MTANEAELKRLMLAGLDGDAAAYRSLLDQLSQYLRRYYRGKLARFGRGVMEAEDLVQEALLALHTRRHTYNPGEPLMPWVHAIARYKLIDHLRRTRGSVLDVPVDDADELVAEHDVHSQVESGHDLRRLLSNLPDKMRRAIQCVKIDGLSVAEAAKRCGMSESSIKVNVHRGMRALSDLITREDTT